MHSLWHKAFTMIPGEGFWYASTDNPDEHVWILPPVIPKTGIALWVISPWLSCGWHDSIVKGRHMTAFSFRAPQSTLLHDQSNPLGILTKKTFAISRALGIISRSLPANWRDG